MKTEFQGRVAVITGAGSGIGEAAARMLSERGASVVLGDIDLSGAEAVAASIRSDGGKAQAVKTDVSSPDDNAKLVEAALRAFGRVDVAFANAGIPQGATPLEDVAVDEIMRLLSVNIAGVVLLARAVATHFKTQQSGVLVATASTAGVRPRPGIQVYSATKGAVIAFVRALALEWAPFGARVCAVSPVATRTPMLPQFQAAAGSVDGDSDAIMESFRKTVPLGRLARPQDIAEAVCFLASDRANMMTGTIMDVDGGRNI